MTSCIADEQLRRFLEGDLAEPARADVDAHIEVCMDCERRLAELSDSTPAAVPESMSEPMSDSARFSASAPPADESHTRLSDEFIQRMTDCIVQSTQRDDMSPRTIGSEAADSLPTMNVPCFGDYQILYEIARGGMGIVYAARQLSLDRIVALKVLPRYGGTSSDTVQRFRREARAASMLHHPNIVPIYEIREESDIIYFAMQLVDGMSLEKVLRRDGYTAPETDRQPTSEDRSTERRAAFETSASEFVSEDQQDRPESRDPEPARANHHAANHHAASHHAASHALLAKSDVERDRTIAEIGRQVAAALAYAHQRGVIHRDIKPSNLILDRTGKVWLADFGLAKHGTDELTGTNEAPGTLRYMAAERFCGQCDERSDVYSLGLTLYELLGRRRAFDATDTLSLLRQVQETTPSDLRSIAPTVPRDLATIVHKAMAKVPDRRYASAADLCDDLGRFLRGEPIQARPVGAAERFAIWAKRNRALAASIVSLAFLVTAVAFVSTIAAFYFRQQQRIQTRLSDEKAAETREATRQRDTAERNAYFADIRQAYQDWRDGNGYQLATGLQRYLPATSDPHAVGGTLDQADVRDWEWFYLLELAQQDEKTILDFAGSVFQLQWSSDGKRLFGGTSEGSLQIWDQQGSPIRQISIPGLRQFALSPDAAQVATVSGDDTLRFWDCETAEMVKQMRIPGVELSSVGWALVPNLVCVASQPTPSQGLSEVFLLDRITGWTLRREKGTDSAVESLLFSPRSHALAVGGPGMGSLIAFLSPATYQSIDGSLVGHWEDQESMSWSPDGRYVAVGFQSHGAAVYEVDAHVEKPTRVFHTPDRTSVDAIAFSPDGKLLLVGNRSQRIDVYDLQTQQLRHTLRGHLGAIRSIAPHPSADLIATCADDGAVKFWKLNEPSPSAPVSPGQHPIEVSVGAVAKNSQDTGSMSNTETAGDLRSSWSWQVVGDRLQVIDTNTGQVVADLAEEGTTVQARLFPVIDQIVFRSQDADPRAQLCRIYNTKDWQETHRLRGWSEAQPCVDVRGDFVIACFRDSLQVFNGRTGELNSVVAAAFHLILDPHLAVALSPDGETFVTGCHGEVKLWDSQTCLEIANFYSHRSDHFIASLAWDHRGRRFATTCVDETVNIWDAREKRLLHTLHGLQHAPTAGRLAFNRNDSRVMAADTSLLKLWDVESGRELLAIPVGPESRHAYEHFVRSDAIAQDTLAEPTLFKVLEKVNTLFRQQEAFKAFQRDRLFHLAQRFAVAAPNYLRELVGDERTWQRAHALVRDVTPIDPGDMEMHLLRALIEYRVRNEGEALRWLSESAKVGGESRYEWLLLSSLVQHRLGNVAQSAQHYNQAARLLESLDQVDPMRFPLIHETLHTVHPRVAQAAPEASRTLTVTTLDDEIADNHTLSLREAVALSRDGTTIRFAVNGTIQLKFGPILIAHSLSIEGPGRDRLTVSSAGRSRLLRIDDHDDGRHQDVTIKGVRFAHAGPSDRDRIEAQLTLTGAISCHEFLQITECVFEDLEFAGARGGAISIAGGGKVIVRGCSFSNCTAFAGGAISVGGRADATIDACTFHENTAQGGWGSGSAIRSDGNLLLVSSTFVNNRAAVGGALHLYARGATSRVAHCTFTANTGSAISLRRYVNETPVCDVVITGCIVSGNQDQTGSALDLDSSDDIPATVSHCLIGAQRGGWIDGGSNLVGVDPQLGPLSDHGGPTKTMALSPSSPAIDAGEPSDLQFDQRGSPFLRTLHGSVQENGNITVAKPDIGAFEYDPSTSGRAAP